jgi:hypothetical protein
MAIYKHVFVTKEFLDSDPTAYFVHGDDLSKAGLTGAARIKCHPHALSFITRKWANENDDGSFYKPEEYAPVFFEELAKLEKIVSKYPNRTCYIPKIGSGPSNRFFIWEKIIQHNLLSTLSKYDNVVFCWEESLVSKS